MITICALDRLLLLALELDEFDDFDELDVDDTWVLSITVVGVALDDEANPGTAAGVEDTAATDVVVP